MSQFKWPFKSFWLNVGIAFAGVVMVGGEAGFYWSMYKAKYGKKTEEVGWTSDGDKEPPSDNGRRE